MENDKKITLELFLMGCTGDRFHSVRVIDQYKEILENEPKMCSFFATVTNLSRISLLMVCVGEPSGLNSRLVGPHQSRVSTCSIRRITIDVSSFIAPWSEHGKNSGSPRLSTVEDRRLQYSRETLQGQAHERQYHILAQRFLNLPTMRSRPHNC